MELCIDRVSKLYGKKLAVDRFSATLTKGVYGLLGPNGSGKTTLMRMLADVMQPSSGEIAFNGADIHKLDEDYRDILGYLPQNFGYYRDFTATDFLLYLSAIKGIEKSAAKKKSAELLETVGLKDEAKSKIKSFSGGMRQRLGIAQALLNDPRILILDEPTAGLDPKERIRFRNLISDVSKDRVVLLSTHIVSDVEYIADHILLMKKGQLLKQGTAEEIARTAQGTVFTATVSPREAEEIKLTYTLSGLRHTDGGVELRILASTPPCHGATPVSPTLEDAYLSHFSEASL